jgi:flagellar basal body-associated protein FliL
MEPNGQQIEDLSDAPNLSDLMQKPQAPEKKKSGLLRKIKWLFILAIILAIAIFVGSTVGVNKLRSVRATSEAKNYVAKLYPGYTIGGSVCQGEDTDGDTYVSCDLNIGNTTENRVINIQCPTIIKSFLGTSCKQARPALVTQ